MLEVVHVSSRGQIVIPEKVRKRLHIKTGSKLVLLEKDDTLIFKKEESVERIINFNEKKESIGWLMLSEKSLKDVWDNPKDDKLWKEYL